ncbi:MAG: Peptidoglycan O-acetyltransferase [Akkermansiaceae bacterium]|nr:Peptidoglycan O-acetyltransferase [Akkermansiaceae bacterium]
MNFTELAFWPRLLAGLLLITLVRLFIPKVGQAVSRYDRCALAALSLWLLSCVGLLTTAIFAAVFTITWAILLLMFRLPPERRKWLLWPGLCLLCAPLAYYKYRVFLMSDVLGLRERAFYELAIPAGISFYTLQKVGMLIDASKLPHWRPRFLDYANFASFFPLVVAGPIERKADLFPQMESFSFQWSWSRLTAGLPWIALGFFYKLCLADNLSAFINKDLMDSAWPILLCTFLFGLKIYFDFCGYSLIALGLAKCLGVDLTLNFRSPYWSGSISQFWRRWHISLSYWLRDYVYFPLGGSRTKRWALNLMAVFVLSGIWHGAGWGFLIWGALHGFFSVVAHQLKGRVRLPWLLGWGLTSVCVFLAWLPFYETRLPILREKAAVLLTPSAYSLSGLTGYLKSYDSGNLVTLVAAISLCLTAIAFEGLSRLRKKDDYAFAMHPLTIALCIACTILLGASEGNEFVYFSF